MSALLPFQLPTLHRQVTRALRGQRCGKMLGEVAAGAQQLRKGRVREQRRRVFGGRRPQEAVQRVAVAHEAGSLPQGEREAVGAPSALLVDTRLQLVDGAPLELRNVVVFRNDVHLYVGEDIGKRAVRCVCVGRRAADRPAILVVVMFIARVDVIVVIRADAAVVAVDKQRVC